MKKNIRKIPQHVTAQLEELPRYVVAGCAKTFSADALRAGDLKHLSVSVSKAGELVLPPGGSIIPPSDQGRYSEWNVDGREIVRDDLPKEQYPVTFEAPSWGSYTTHSVTQIRERYPRENISPRLNAIKIAAADAQPGRSHYALVFEVEEVLDKKAPNFDERLLECLNLLQENVGATGVQKTGATPSDYVKTLAVSWEILPPGSRDEAYAHLFRGRTVTLQQRDQFAERYDFFAKLTPQKIVVGTSTMQRYLGAQITSDLVVFENMQYGNAVYVMYEEWRTLSQKNRVELMAGLHGKNFDRVVHRDGWKDEVKELIKVHLKSKKRRG